MDQSILGGRLRFFLSDWICFPFSRRSLLPFDGFVFLRCFGGVATWRRKSRSLLRQSATLRPRSRNRWLVMVNTPSRPMRLANVVQNRSLTPVGSDGEFVTSHFMTAFVATLLTFCPPGPPLRTKSKSNSRSGIWIRSLMFSMEGDSDGNTLKSAVNNVTIKEWL